MKTAEVPQRRVSGSQTGWPFSSRPTPAASSSNPSRFGGRPAATSRRSKSRLWPFQLSRTPSAQGSASGPAPRWMGNSASSRARSVSETSRSCSPATLSPRSKSSTRTPSRASAWPSSRPSGPAPITPTEAGRSASSNRLSLVSTRSFTAEKTSGTAGAAPVAMTMARVFMVRPSESRSRSGPQNAAEAAIRVASGMRAMSFCRPATNRSRSRRSRAITARPSMRGLAAMPNSSAWRIDQTASPAAISSFEGMQPTVAQVVPAKCGSISRVEAPTLRA